MVENVKGDKIRIESHGERLNDVRQFSSRICSEAGLSDLLTKRIVRVTDEAVTNIVNHAKATDDGGEVEVSMDVSPVRLRVMIRDHTNGTMTPGERRETDFEETKHHKLGIFLMQRIMDEISYTFKKGFRNDLEMIRFLKN